jgi:hypothetical protein
VKDAEHAAPDTRLPRRTRQGLELLGGLFAQFESFDIGRGLIAEFLTARLNGKVFLRLRDLGLSRVAVLRDQITGEAR